MTGGLRFWEQDSLAFETRLPGVILPGPLCFVHSNETVVTCSAACTVEAYKYIDLAAHADSAKVRAAWALDIGEHALDVQFAPTLPSATVVVLGERTVFWLTGEPNAQFVMRIHSWGFPVPQLPCAATSTLEQRFALVSLTSSTSSQLSHKPP